jgi:hypothetical protein
MSNISPQKLEANRKNSTRSTGPTSVFGKLRSSLNALKHGATAQTPVLPGEDPALFEARVDAYKADLQPRNTLENEMVERMALMSTQYDRANRVDVARMAENVLTVPDLAAKSLELEADALGQRLFFDRRGPLQQYPNREYLFNQPRTSWSGLAVDPDDPARLVKQLEFTGPGCRLLLARWAELRTRLETTGECWQSPEKLMAIRLLGRQPLDAADVREVTQVFLACHVLDPQHKHAFFELTCELDEDEFKQYDKRLKGRNLDAMRPTDATAARAMLLGLVDRAMDRLRPLAEAHRLREEKVAALRPAMVAFDDSAEGERQRRQAMACERGIHRNLASIIKARKEGATPEPCTLRPVDPAYLQALAAAGDFLQNEPTGASEQDLQNEPTGDRAGQDPRIEAAGDNAGYRSQDQSTAGFRDLPNEPDVVEQDRKNEPTDVEQDRKNEPTDVEQDLQNEPTGDDRDHREGRGDCTEDDKPPGKRMEWFQMMAHYKRVQEENLRKQKELDQKRGDGRGIGVSARSARASPADRRR